MRTAQLMATDFVVFSIVQPQVETNPPPGTIFVHYDEDKTRVELGWVFDSNAGTFHPKPPNP